MYIRFIINNPEVKDICLSCYEPCCHRCPNEEDLFCYVGVSSGAFHFWRFRFPYNKPTGIKANDDEKSIDIATSILFMLKDCGYNIVLLEGQVTKLAKEAATKTDPEGGRYKQWLITECG